MTQASDASDCPRAVRDFLSGSPELVNKVSNRMYPEVAPQGLTEDWINISEVSLDPEYSLGGEIGTARSVIQIDYWSSAKDARARAKLGGELIRNRLSGYRGALNDDIFANGCQIIRPLQTLASAPPAGSELHRYRCTMDFQIIHTVNVPTLT